MARRHRRPARGEAMSETIQDEAHRAARMAHELRILHGKVLIGDDMPQALSRKNALLVSIAADFLDERAAAVGVWTKDKPTEPGKYWVWSTNSGYRDRHGGTVEPLAVLAKTEGDGLAFWDLTWNTYEPEDDGFSDTISGWRVTEGEDGRYWPGNEDPADAIIAALRDKVDDVERELDR